MKKKLIVCIFILLFTIGCTNNYKEIVKEYYKGTNNPKEKIIYPNKKDTSNYINVYYYLSGDTSGKYEYQNYILKHLTCWYESGKKSEEEIIIGIKETPYRGQDTVIGLIGLIENIGTFKHWNKQGILIYETNLLSNMQEQKIKRDSLGNVLSVDTITY